MKPTYLSSHALERTHLGALWSCGWRPRQELGFRDFRSQAPTGVVQEAGVRLDEAAPASSVWVRFADGYAPAEVRVVADGVRSPWQAASADGELSVPVAGPIQTVVVQQRRGSAERPDELRVMALVVCPPEAPGKAPQDRRFRVGLELLDGSQWWPRAPWASDGDPDTALDVGEARTLLVDLPEERAVSGLRLSLVRLAGVPGDLTSWLGAVDGVAGWAEDWSRAGIVAGLVDLEVGFEAVARTRRIRLPLPQDPTAPLAIASVGLLGDVQEWPLALPSALRSTQTMARRLTASQAVAPDGTVLYRQAGRAGCLHVASDGRLVGVSLRDDLQALPLADVPAFLGLGPTVRVTPGRHELRIELVDAAPAPVQNSSHAPSLSALVPLWVSDAEAFVQPDGTVPYALWPSVYAGEVFGLEEFWLMEALARWSDPKVAWRALQATYLHEGHLDPAHRLYDLRNGLAPWQTLRLARLTGEGPTLDEVRLLRSCGEWVSKELARPHDGQPGLLPPGRFGGDLDMPTQSLFMNAANVVGLEALAQLDSGQSGRWGDLAADLRGAVDAALDNAVDHRLSGDFQPLHTGGADPGDYYQLVASGIFLTLDYAPDHAPVIRRVVTSLERHGRLHEGLPRFDAWGSPGPGLDAQYALGHLLYLARQDEVEQARAGLQAMVDLTMDPASRAFREVCALLPEAHELCPDSVVPGIRMARSEPCSGPLGVALLVADALGIGQVR